MSVVCMYVSKIDVRDHSYAQILILMFFNIKLNNILLFVQYVLENHQSITQDYQS